MVGSVMLFCATFYLFGGGEGRRSLTLAEERLTESSGVCVTNDSTVVWSHNDSGDIARLFAFTSTGKLLAEVCVEGADAVDWEDICSFRVGETEYLAIGDIGDNTRKRKSVVIYVIKVPEDLGSKPSIEVGLECKLTVTYPDGPQNCEALAYDSISEAFVLATKELFRCRLFKVDASGLTENPRGLAENRIAEAQFLQAISLPMVTAADIATDGKRLALATYGPAALLVKDKNRWATTEPGDVQVISVPTRKQGESICFADENRKLLLTSEFAPTPLFELACPKPAASEAKKSGSD